MRMLQLQQLHGPFDIRQASPAEFEMPVASHTTWQTFRLHTRLESAYLLQLVVDETLGRVSERVRDIRKEVLGQLLSPAANLARNSALLPHTLAHAR